MKKKCLIAAGAVMCLLTGCKESEITKYEAGLIKLEEHDYRNALACFEDAREEEGETVQILRAIGIAWTGQKVFDKAEAAFSAALKAAGSSDRAMKADLYLYLADARYHQENYSGCIEACDELFRMKKVKDGYFLRGSAYLRMNQYKEADTDFKKFISDSREYDDYLDVYKIYKECDLNADGVEYLEKALEFPPKSAEASYDRGRIYYYLGEYSKAEKELKKAWEDEYAQAGIYLGKVYIAAQELEKAREVYKKCRDADQLKAEAYNGLAYCAIQEEDYKSALSYLQKGLEIDDSEVNQVLLFNEIVVYERLTDIETAKKRLNLYLKKYPADEKALREKTFLQTR